LMQVEPMSQHSSLPISVIEVTTVEQERDSC
jgi:hypothetical protein